MNLFLVAKGQKMAMKNYAKQLNAQIEEVVAEVKFNIYFSISVSSHIVFLSLHSDSKSTR